MGDGGVLQIRKAADCCTLSAALTLDAILRLALSFRLPLHIAWGIGSAARKRHNVIHDVSFPAVAVSGLPLEFIFRSATSLYASARITL